MHAGEHPIDAAVARDLIGAQFPRWRGLPVRRVASSGTVNAIFRLGDRLAARFPLRGADPGATRRELESEAVAARELGAATRFPVPALVAMGEPGPGYPLPWSVHTWLHGRTGDEDDPSGEVTFASDLAEFISAVRAIGTRGRAFSGRGRGGDLKDHDEWMRRCLRESEGLLDVPRLNRMWTAFRELPREAPDVMSHGDLTPGNVLTAGGHLSGVIDIGSYGAADPALDLISAWNLLEAGPRQVFRTALRCTSLEWERSKAWAFQQAMGLVWYYADSNPVMSRLGRATLDRIISASEALPGSQSPAPPQHGMRGSAGLSVPVLRVAVMTDSRLPVRDRELFLAEPHIAALSVSAGEDRGPLTMPIWYQYEPGGEAWVLTPASSRKARLIESAGRFTLMVERTLPTVRYVSVEGPVSRMLPGTDEMLLEITTRYLPPDKVQAYLDFARTELGEHVAIYLRPQRWLTADLGPGTMPPGW
jgi:aminoglycoside phosphotransferase (APT) family kinase protein